jgi:hypothetical protein
MSKKPPQQPPSSYTGFGPSEVGRAIPPETIPSPDQRAGNYKSEATTYFTKAGPTRQLYTADRKWAKVTLLLQTAGPVAVGFSQTIIPVLSGKGILLATLVPAEFRVARGNKLWIASTAVNRVSVQIEEEPWLEQILGGVVRGFDILAQLKMAGGRR